jgi:heme-degrading monooxygenase HmoA
MATRVMVFAKIKPGEEKAFEEAYAEVSRKVKGTPGHLRDELLRDATDPSSYILLAEWESKEAFLAWEDAPIHRQTTGPMNPHWEGGTQRKIYDVVVRGSS